MKRTHLAQNLLLGRVVVLGAALAVAAPTVPVAAQDSPPEANAESEPDVETAAGVISDADADAGQAADAEAGEAAGAEAGGERELSVPPLDHAVYPDDRPEWVEAVPELEGVEAVWPVASPLCVTPDLATESLRVQVHGAVAAYAEHVLGAERAARLGASPLLKLDLREIGAEDTYVGTARVGDQLVYEHAVRLRFDEDYRQRLLQEWQRHEVTHRLSVLGFAGGAGVCLLFTATGVARRLTRNPGARGNG